MKELKIGGFRVFAWGLPYIVVGLEWWPFGGLVFAAERKSDLMGSEDGEVFTGSRYEVTLALRRVEGLWVGDEEDDVDSEEYSS